MIHTAYAQSRTVVILALFWKVGIEGRMCGAWGRINMCENSNHYRDCGSPVSIKSIQTNMRGEIKIVEFWFFH